RASRFTCASGLRAEPWIDAKNLQMASGAAKNFVQIARMSRGMDQRTNGQGNSGSGDAPQTLLFVGMLQEAPKKSERQAEAVNVSATEIPANAAPESPSANPPGVHPVDL